MISIRAATIGDTGDILDMIRAIAVFHGQEAYVKTTRAEFEKAGFGANPKFGVLLAEVDGRPAGFLSYTWEYSIWNNGDYMHMDDLFVFEEFRGQDIGTKLMLEAKLLCAEKGVSLMGWSVEKDNSRAKKFYRKLGADYSENGQFRWRFKQEST